MNLNIEKRIASSGFGYDANGNIPNVAAVSSNIALSYDVENRTGGSWFDMENRPMFKNSQWYLYGLHGERLGSWNVNVGSHIVIVNGWPYSIADVTQTQTSRNIYFAGRLIQSNGKTVVRDQVGSVRVNEDGEKFEYYPFGEEITLRNPQDREKFGTYTRDSVTGLDDANQRTYASTHGVFTAADRYQASAGAGEPGSWNRYAYTRGDPANRSDPSGLLDCNSYTKALIYSFGLSDLTGDLGPCEGYDTATWKEIDPCLQPVVVAFAESGSNPFGCTYSIASSPPDRVAPPSYSPECPLEALTGQYTVQSGVVALFAPDLAAKLDLAFTALNSQGIIPDISSGFRTAAKQVSVQGSPCGAAQVSWHQVGEAIDFTNNSSTSVKAAIKAALTGIGLTWGGVFRRRDPIHYQNSPPGTAPSPERVAACEREHP